MQSVFNGFDKTLASTKFEYKWEVVDYFPAQLTSPDFSHPLFPRDVWYLELDPQEINWKGDSFYFGLKLFRKYELESVIDQLNGYPPVRVMIYKDTSCQLDILVHSNTDQRMFETRIYYNIKAVFGKSYTFKVVLVYPKNVLLSSAPQKLVDEVIRLAQDQHFLEDTSSRDFTLIAMDGQSVKVHSFLLAARSSVMKTMLMMDSTKEKQSRSMMLKETPFYVLEKFSEYVYSDIINFSNLDMKQAIDVFMFADQYDIPGFKSFSQDFISGNIKNASDARLVKEVVFKVDSTIIEESLKQFYSSTTSSSKE